MFKRDIHHYHVIELEKTAALPELTNDLKESLKALRHMPAFQYLLHRLRVKKAAVQNALNEGFQREDRELRYLQAGLFWLGDIDRDIRVLTQDASQPRPAAVDELAEFKRVAQSISLIGNDETPQG